MRKPLGMLPSQKMMDLILQSVEKSDLFRNSWDRVFVKIILEMFLTKGDFPHFINYYGEKMDIDDLEVYFKNTIIDMFDKQTYEEIKKEIFGDDEDE